MATNSKFDKLATVLDQTVMPSNTKKVPFVYRDYSQDIIMSKEKIASNIAQANASSSAPLFGTTVVYSINPGDFMSKPYLRLTITGDGTAVSTNMLGFNCISKVEVWHGKKLMEYSGETLAQILMAYARDDEARAALQTYAGGAGGTLTATTWEYYVPLLFAEDPHSILGGTPTYYPTGLIKADLQFKVTYKAQASILSTVGTVTGFTDAQLRYTSTWMNETELQLDKKNYELFVYDYRQINSGAVSCSSGVAKEFDITSFNENAEIMDILFKCISAANITALQVFQNTEPTTWRFQVNSKDFYYPDTKTEGKFNTYMLKGYDNYLYSTYVQQKVDCNLHAKVQNAGDAYDTFMTNGVNFKYKTLKLFLTMGSSTSFTVNFVAVLKKKLRFVNNSIEEIYIE